MTGIDDIAAERRRQIESEGWTPEHDDEHATGELARAAICYIKAALADRADRAVMDTFQDKSGTPFSVFSGWPWDDAWWKPKSRRRDLVRAGALIAAEIDRLDRLAAAQRQEEE